MSTYQRPVVNASGQAGPPLIPPANYRVYCQKCDFGASQSSGNPMNTLHLQILSPESVTVDGVVVKTAGQSGKMYISYDNDSAVMKRAVEALAKLGVPLPAQAASFEEDVKAIGAAVSAYMLNMTFEMVVSSQRRPMTAPGGVEPLKDSAGNVIQSSEQANFAVFNIVGLPKPITELGAGAVGGPF